MAQNDRTTGLVGNSGLKVPVRAASTAALVLTAEQTVDGVALVTGDRVLVKDQASSVNNGIYVVDTGVWSRAKDADGAYDWVQGSVVLVYGGTANGNKFFEQTTANPITVGSSALVFTAMNIQFTGSSKVTWCGTATGTANAIVLTPATAATALTAGDSYLFKSGAAANTAATTIAISGLAAATAQSNGTAMVGGEIEISKWYRATVDGAGNLQVERIAPALLLEMLTAKGDIIAASADQTAVRVAVGNNGYVLTADSSQGSGLNYGQRGGIFLLSTGLGTVADGVTTYIGIGATSTSEIVVRLYMPQPGTIKNMYAAASVSTAGTRTYTARKNGGDQSLTCASTGATGTASDTTNSFAVVAGDYVDVKLVTSGGANVAIHTVSLEFVKTAI